MAEAEEREVDESKGEDNDEVSSTSLDCPICLQPCVHPVELPCTHIFCFLCIKGVAMQGGQSRCAICRSNISSNVLTHPRLKDISQLYKDPKLCGDYQWFYESRSGGWWQYEERTMAELERAFEAKLQTTQLLIAGHLYEIDFAQMQQYRVGTRTMARRIKRDVPTAEKRGIAGLRIVQPGQAPPIIPGNGRGRRRSGPGRGGGRMTGPTIHVNPGGQPTSSGNQSSGGSLTVSVQGPGISDSVDIVICSSDDDGNDEVEEEEEEEEFEEEDDDDEDMELGKEEENLESSDSSDDENEPRDGARAPTSRSDRSNSSVNPTPPPSSRNGASPNRSGSRGANQPVTSATFNNNFSNPTSPSPVAPSSLMHGDVEIEVNGTSGNNNTTCIRVGPSLRITLDFNHSVRDEIL